MKHRYPREAQLLRRSQSNFWEFSLMRIAIICSLLFLWNLPSYAQFNDSTNYYVNLASTGIINKTNEGSTYVLNNSLKFNLYRKIISLNTTNTWIYGEQRGNLSNNDLSTAVDFSIYKTIRNFYYWGLALYEKSFSLKIDNRLQSGLGGGYNLIDKENIIITLTNGVLYEKSDLYDAETTADPNYETLRNSFRIKFRVVINNVIVLDGVDFLQNSLSEREDYIIRSNTNLSIQLREWISLNSSLTYNKLNRTNRENLLFNIGLKVEKYF